MNEILSLSLTGIAIMIADILNLKKAAVPLALIGLATTIGLCVFDWNTDTLWYRMVKTDNFALAFTVVMCSTALLWILMADDYMARLKSSTDRYALIMFTLVGAFCMVSFNNMVLLFIGIEILSVSLYVLAGSNKSDLNSSEAAFKYFLMGAFASGFLLFGIALIYGLTGSFDIIHIRQTIGKIDLVANKGILTIGILMILIGMGFKISAAPFHFWAPDVYTGAPTPITAYMATVVKTAAIASLFRLFIIAFPQAMDVWLDVVVAMLVLSLLIGNVSAVLQHDAKRMLAYSSISHVGYMLLAVLCTNSTTDNNLLFYTAAYSVATIVAFMVLYLVSQKKGTTAINAFDGLGKKNPLLAIAMTMSLLSMAGIPPMAGFMAKYFIFANALGEGHFGLVLFAIAMSLVGVYYYFKIIIAMFFHEDTEGVPVKADILQTFLIIIGCGLLLLLGLMPNLVSGVL
jgi:NADH-quinone oxidoreductase subunit N